MDKNKLRERIYLKCKDIPLEDRISAKEAILSNFKKLDLTPKYKVFGSYYPLPHELDISLINRFIYDNKLLLSLPEVKEKEEDMVYHKWTPNSVMQKDWCGIPFPIGNCIDSNHLNVVICAMTGFDRHGYRLGTGGGFYDKFFANHPHNNIIKVGAAFSIQELSFIPNDQWDIKMDYIITEKEIIEI